MRAHQDRYRKFWKMADSAVDCAMLGLPIGTVFGWHVRAGSGFSSRGRLAIPATAPGRSMLNFPMQANGAEMMRLAACLATERGIEVCAPVHDAFLICAPIDRIEADTAAMRAAMDEAARAVLDGFPNPDRSEDRPLSRSIYGQARRRHVGARHAPNRPVPKHA